MLTAALVTLTVAVQPADTSLRPADFVLTATTGNLHERVDGVEAVPFLRSSEPLSLAIVAPTEGYEAAVDTLANAHRPNHTAVVNVPVGPHGIVADLAEARVALAGLPGKRAIVVVGNGAGAGPALERTVETLKAENIRVYMIGVDVDPHRDYHLYQLGKLGDYVRTNRAGLLQAADRVVADIDSEYTVRFPAPAAPRIGPVTLSVELRTSGWAQIVEAPEYLENAAVPRRHRVAAPAPGLGTLGYIILAQMFLIVGATAVVSARSRRPVRTG